MEMWSEMEVFGLSALTAASAVSAARTQQQKAAAQAIAMMCLVFICVP
jgi:hypothetical protein